MAITVDTVSEAIRTGTGSPTTGSHVAAASGVKGVVIALIHGTSSTDHISAVSYGGSALTRIQRNVDTATEAGAAELWFLGSAIPQGTQTWSYTSGATTDDIHCRVITLLSPVTTLAISANNGIDNNVANPSVTLTTNGANGMAFAAMYSGLTAETSLTAGTGCTKIGSGELAGNFCSTVVRQTTSGTSDFSISVTAATDDVAFAAMMVVESVQSITVEAGGPTLSNPAVGGVAEVESDPAQFSVAGSVSTMALAIVVTAAALQPTSSDINTWWQQPGESVNVEPSGPSFLNYDVAGRLALNVTRVQPTLAPSIIDFQLSSGSWTLPVDVGAPAPLGQAVEFEDGRYFDVARPTIAGSSVNLVRAATVQKTDLSIVGSNITLTPGSTWSLGVEVPALSMSTQDVVLSKTWSLAVDTASLSPSTSNIIFDWESDDTVVVEPALISISGSTVAMGQRLPESYTALSLSPQTITFKYDWSVAVETLSPTFQTYEVGLVFEYDLGVVVDPGSLSVAGNSFTMFLGDGQPTKVRSTITSDHIEIGFSKALSSITRASEKIVG